MTGGPLSPGGEVVVWCPDWPLRAAGVPPTEPAAIVTANRVAVTSPAARAEGVEVGLRRREARSRCPHLRLVDADGGRDARAFEPVVATVGSLTPRVAVTRPGELTFPARAASRWAGGDRPLAYLVRSAVDELTAPDGGSIGARVGVAVGVATATLAARRAPPIERVLVVDPAGTAGFLTPLPIGVLVDHGVPADLVERFVLLGLDTLGALAALPDRSILERFGPAGDRARHLARGLDPERPALREPTGTRRVERRLDPPLDRIDRAAFMAKHLADELGARLTSDGESCSAVVIGAVTVTGEERQRCWRQDGPLRPTEIADRIRWQLDGWMRAPPPARPTGGIVRLWAEPVEVGPDRGRAVGLWGGDAADTERVGRAVTRLTGLLGPEAVTVAELVGSRAPGERIRRIPAGSVTLRPDRPVRAPGRAEQPWPGTLPPPTPTVLPRDPPAVVLIGADGHHIDVDDRGQLTGRPVTLAGPGRPPRPVVTWAGPWPVDERWWHPSLHRRGARLQVVVADGVALLLFRGGAGWHVEGRYG